MIDKSRVARMAWVHGIVLCLIATTAPNVLTDTLPLPEQPNADDLVLLDELFGWLGEDQEQDPFHSGEARLAEAVRERSTSFDIFRHYHSDGLRDDQLEGLPHGEVIRETAERFGIDVLLLASIVEAESAFDSHAVSRSGAIGLMQVMPETAGSICPALLFDPEVNVKAGAGYLRQLLNRYEGDLELSLAAYNAGPGAVSRFGGVPPYKETRRYVDKVLGLYINHHREVWRSSEAGELIAVL